MNATPRKSSKSALWLILGCSATAFALVLISAQIEFTGTGGIRLAKATATVHGKPAPTKEAAPKALSLKKLPCFTCHNIGK